ncbi:hypothetical protein NKJ10_25815 [Mesorhizobium sp. M0204]|uniref:hypothetical protein n=1 Tax=Mesorhizobium sp. M0204 TaxID=2956913 RepID=UPI003334C75D
MPLIREAIANSELFRAHAFEYACATNDIEHRTTKAKHPWTTDVIDKSLFDKSALFSCRARTTAWGDLRPGRIVAEQAAVGEVRALPRSFYRRTSFAASVRAFLGPRGFQPATKRA